MDHPNWEEDRAGDKEAPHLLIEADVKMVQPSGDNASNYKKPEQITHFSPKV